jgi:NitT/TauT family transport system substrate-binding protein
MRLHRALAAVALIAGTLVAAGCSGGDGNPASIEKVNYSTGFNTFGREAYVYVAKEKGFFKDAGIDVTVTAGNGTGENLKLLMGGKADFTPVDFTGALVQLGTGKAQGVVAVAAIQQRTLACIMALDGRGISRPKDLEGKTVGDPAGSTIGLMFPIYARLAGVDAGKVRFVNAASAQLPQLLAAGTVDTIGQFVVGTPTIAEAAGGKKPVVLPYSDYLTDVYGNVLITATTLAKQKPDLVKRFSGALLKGLRYAVDNPEEAGQILHKYVPTQDATLAAGELTLMKKYVGSSGSGVRIGTLDKQRVARSIALMQGANAIPSGITPDRLVSFDLTPQT